MPKLRVMLFDDADDADVFRRVWEAILGETRFGAEVRLVRYTDVTDVEMEQLLLKERPHIVVLDNVVEKAEPERKNYGVELIQRFKDKHQDTLFILYTGKSFSIDQLGARRPNPDFLVTKTYLDESGYKKYLGINIDAAVRRAPLVTLSGAGAGDPILASLVEQVSYEPDVSKGRDTGGYSVKLTQLTGGFSGASVYRMEISGEDRYSDLPVVLKVGPIEQIHRERVAFSKSVRWQLPHTMRVDIIGEGVAAGIGAIAYAFVLGGQRDAIQASQALGEGKAKAVDTVIKLLFRADRTGWHRSPRETGKQIVEYFTNHREFDPSKDQKRNDGLAFALREIAASEGVSLVDSGEELWYASKCVDTPRRGLLSIRRSHRVVECLGHGDLNANNVFMDSKLNSIAIIDFEQSGWNHVFRDFVSFESSIRLEFNSGEPTTQDLLRLCELERAAMVEDAEYEASWPSYLEQIMKLRKVARTRFVSVPWELYEVALGLHSWKLFGVSNWSLEQKKRLAACLFAALGGLRSARPRPNV